MKPPPTNQNRKAWFRDVLAKYKRIAICGAPNTGKTTLSRLADRPVIHTDDYRTRTWEAVPHAVIADVLDVAKDSDRYVVEGIQVPRCLRKGMEVDAVVYLAEPLEENSKGQAAMGKGAFTVLADWYATHKDVPVLQAPPIPESERADLDNDPAD